jgi:hypothetical protein
LRVDRPDQQQQSKSSQGNGELWAIIVAFQSLFAYLQNLSATINLPDVQLPEQLRSILQYITRFIDLLILSIPTIPAFDLRAELAIVSFVLPFLVIIFFLWFVTPFYHVAYQLLDLLVLICVSMVLADAFTVSWTQVATIVLSFSGFYFLIRITMRVVKSRPSPWDLDDFAVHVCHYFMNEVIPGVQSALSRAELEDAIWKFSRYVDLARSCCFFGNLHCESVEHRRNSILPATFGGIFPLRRVSALSCSAFTSHVVVLSERAECSASHPKVL